MKQSDKQALEYNPKRDSSWCVEDQPAVKLAQQGSQAVTVTDLIAIILNGTANATEVARNLYAKSGNSLNTLSHFSIEQLKHIEGISDKKAIALHASFELGRRNTTSEKPNHRIRNSETVRDIFSPLLADLEHEEFWLLCLNRANRVLGKYKISQGGLSGTVVDTRIILKKALDSLSSCLILVHNHPSGNTQPSKADITITKKIKEAAEVMEIKVLDHVIICANSQYFSFADEGLI